MSKLTSNTILIETEDQFVRMFGQPTQEPDYSILLLQHDRAQFVKRANATKDE